MNYKTESKFQYKGYQCEVIFHELGHRCGYVTLPKGHKYEGENYVNIPVECHGGLTFGKTDKGGVFKIGFDCAHYGDKFDFEKSVEYGLMSKEKLALMQWLNMADEGEVRTQSFVEEELKSIVDQLKTNTDRNDLTEVIEICPHCEEEKLISVFEPFICKCGEKVLPCNLCSNTNCNWTKANG